MTKAESIRVANTLDRIALTLDSIANQLILDARARRLPVRDAPRVIHKPKKK